MPQILTGLSLMITDDFLSASYPLFDQGEVDLLEWSFDTAFNGIQIPNWAQELLSFYSSNDRLLGHLVFGSIFSGNWNTERQALWLDCFEQHCKSYKYLQISEHYGFSAGGDFVLNSPLPFPQSEKILRLASERLQVLSSRSGAKFGLENLAFAFSAEDAVQQAKFISKLLGEIDGFMLLDLHNLYCQMINFSFSAEEILNLYPLERVSELHISGGSWSEYSGAKDVHRIRRDTHDEKVPVEVLELLALVLNRCPNLRYVIFERLAETIKSSEDAEEFRKDYIKIKETVNQHACGRV